MDDIIQKIIDSEKMAQAVVSEAYEERRTHELKMRSELDAYREKSAEENRARIEQFAAQQRKEADIGVKHSEDAARLKIVQLQQTAAGQRDEWIRYLYQKILDGEIG